MLGFPSIYRLKSTEQNMGVKCIFFVISQSSIVLIDIFLLLCHNIWVKL